MKDEDDTKEEKDDTKEDETIEKEDGAGGWPRRMGETEVSDAGGNSFFFLIKCTHHAPCMSPTSFLISYEAMAAPICSDSNETNRRNGRG